MSKKLKSSTVILLACWLYAGSLQAASPEVEAAKNHGARGKVTLRVVDSQNKPVEKAQISAAFFHSDLRGDYAVSEEQTDASGLFVATGKTIHSMNYTITKQGFYTTNGQYWFVRRETNCVQNGRWQPWNPTNTVVLKERKKNYCHVCRKC